MYSVTLTQLEVNVSKKRWSLSNCRNNLPKVALLAVNSINGEISQITKERIEETQVEDRDRDICSDDEEKFPDFGIVDRP